MAAQVQSVSASNEAVADHTLRQPWRAVWPQVKGGASGKERQVTYDFSKGAKMNVEGSAGEAHQAIIYDTGNAKTSKN